MTAPDPGFRTAVLEGLRRADKRIPCKYLYDARGSMLFERICTLPEYYLTRTEIRLLARHAADIAALVGPRCRIVEFGAGSSRKIRLLLAALDRPAAYLPVDVSRDYLTAQAARLSNDYPHMTVTPVVADFLGDITLPPSGGHGRTLGFFPGSTIGNLPPAEARAFLARSRRLIGDDGLMVVGVDLCKPAALLEPAYDDSAGVTAAFTLNLLARINRELDGGFDLDGFRHSARWDPGRGCVLIHLVSRRDQEVAVAGERVRFHEGERIHIEDSHKYSVAGFHTLARDAGYQPAAVWVDDQRLFSLHGLRPG
jgi:dimethylhistidine N-methyltransferase